MKITVNVGRSSTLSGDMEVPPFDADLELPPPSKREERKAQLPGGGKVVQAVFITDKNNKVVKISNSDQMKGNVCFVNASSSSRSEKELFDITLKAFGSEANSLILVDKKLSYACLPIITVQHQYAELLDGRSKCQSFVHVTFTKKSVHQAPQEVSRRSYASAVVVGKNPNQAHKAESGSSSPPLLIPEHTRNDEGLSVENALKTPSNQEPSVPKKNKSFLKRTMDSFVETVEATVDSLMGKKNVGMELVKILPPSGLWIEQPDRFSIYRHALGLLQTECNTVTDLGSFANALQNHVIKEQTKVDILLVLICCQTFVKVAKTPKTPKNPSEQWRKFRSTFLVECIFECIRKLEMSSASGRLKDMNSSIDIDFNIFLDSLLSTCVDDIECDVNVPHEVITKIVWLRWYHCGTLTHGTWPKLRFVIDGDYFGNEREQLKAFMGPVSYRSLGLSLKSDGLSFLTLTHQLFGEQSQMTSDASRLLEVHPRLVPGIFTLITNERDSDGILAWMNALTCLRFVDKDTFNKIKLFNLVCEKSSFKEYRSFEQLNSLYQTVDMAHPNYWEVKSCISTNIFKTLRLSENTGSKKGVSMLDFVSLLDLDVAHVLISANDIDELKSFIIQKVTSPKRLDEKLQFLGKVHNKFVKDEWDGNPVAFSNFVQDVLIEVMTSESDHLARVEAALRVAKKDLSMFASSNHQITTILSFTSHCLSTSDTGRAFLHHPEKLADLMTFDRLDQSTFLGHLSHWLVDALMGTTPTLFEAVYFCKVVLKSSDSPKTKTIASDILSIALYLWDPQHLEDMFRVDAATLDMVFTYTQQLSICGSERDIDKSCGTVHNARSLVEWSTVFRLIIETWLHRFHNGDISLEGMKTIHEDYDERKWAILVDIAPSTSVNISPSTSSIPLKQDLQEKMNEMESLKSDIRSNLSIEYVAFEGTSELIGLKQLLQAGYGIVPSTDTQLHQLFSCFSCLLETTLETSDMNEDQLDRSVSFSETYSLHEYLSALRSKYESNLRILAYFSKSLPILLGDIIHECNNVTSAEIFLDKISDAALRLKGWFDPKRSFDKAKDYLHLIKQLNGNVEDEINLVARCPELNIADDCLDRLLLCAAMDSIAPLLRDVVNCSWQYKFAFSEADTQFRKLEGFVTQLESTEGQETVESIAGMSFELLVIFDPETIDKSDSFLSNELLSWMSILKFFTSLSQCSDVWTLAKERQWFGDAGMAAFYEEYRTVTNVSLGDCSFEMTVLDSLEPAICCISVLGGLLDSIEISSVLLTVRNNHNIKAASVASRSFIELHTTQQHISRIREWFDEGMDDMAAIFNKFEAISENGEYTIKRCTDVLREEKIEICLTYTQLRGMETSNLLGKKVSDFISQLGFIQNENEALIASVKLFTDEYKILNQCIENYNYLESVGIGDIDKSLRYKAGQPNLSLARELCDESTGKLRQCKDWLIQLRKRYSLSLLFWTEELRQIYHILVKTSAALRNQDTTKYDDYLKLIRSMVSRVVCDDFSYSNFEVAVSESDVLQRVGDTDESWVEVASIFIEGLHTAAGKPRDQMLQKSRGGTSTSILCVHTLAVDDERKKDCSLRLLRHIYMTRLPEAFEILDGSAQHSEDEVSVFLDRVSSFPFNTFTILNVEDLPGKHQDMILTYLSQKSVTKAGIRLHCVQDRTHILHSSPWVEGLSWDEKTLPGTETILGAWCKEKVIDGVNFTGVHVLWSSNPGTGKTKFIKEKMTQIKDLEEDCEVATVVIHEGSTMASIANMLKKKFSMWSANRVIHFSIAFMEGEGTTRFGDMLNNLFLSFLVLHNVHDAASGNCFSWGPCKWHVFVELQSWHHQTLTRCENEKIWLQKNIPIVSYCCRYVEPHSNFIVDEEVRRVCTYLRAYDDGTINRKFLPRGAKRILFVLDESGSMNGDKFLRAITSTISIIESHVHLGDSIGVMFFDHKNRTIVPFQEVGSEQEKEMMLNQIRTSSCNGGGTSMYSALSLALQTLDNEAAIDDDFWLICLTDGQSADSIDRVHQQIQRSPTNLHIILIGIDLSASLHWGMNSLCSKFHSDQVDPSKSFFVPTTAGVGGIENAFACVGAAIPVSQTFALDGHLSDSDCRELMERFLPPYISKDNKLLQKFWVQFLYRRVKVFDENEDFNYNEKHEDMGGSLMETMLSEVHVMLEQDQNRSWSCCNHSQLIYDFSTKGKPEFRLICTSPEDMNPEKRKKLESLDLPGFVIHTPDDLRQRSTLDRFISQSMSIPLQERDGEMRLACVDDNNFVLTRDFAIKLLNIHERVACKVPCIMEGETGVSKTALTKMYSILSNSALQTDANISTAAALCKIESDLKERLNIEVLSSAEVYDIPSTLERLSELIGCGLEPDDYRYLHDKLAAASLCRGALFEDLESKLTCETYTAENVNDLLVWFAGAKLEPIFFEVNVHASLTEAQVLSQFEDIRRIARKLSHTNAVVMVFLDEINTSSIMGLFKEIVIDHSICGDALEANIVVVSACNPARKQFAMDGEMIRESDLAKEWASGHYQVSEMKGSLGLLKWAYGSLNKDQEREFIFRRIQMLNSIIPPYLQASLTELICTAQEAIRGFAEHHIRERMKQLVPHFSRKDDALDRSRSVVSLRDIQRVFDLFRFFKNDFILVDKESSTMSQHRHAMLLAIAVVYYLRLDRKSRRDFLVLIGTMPMEKDQSANFLEILTSSINKVIEGTAIPDGVALTIGIKENIFMTVVCSLSRTPLMIIGPPGCSKTLAVNIVIDNANGEESRTEFYRKKPRIQHFHYQCSKTSTSNEVASVFDRAIQRQDNVDASRQQCLVFMDEAGLPEEDKESLKVLHYYLEGHMSTKASVAYVAITNHVLDAAKSNRCVSLLRPDANREELLTIAVGVLFDTIDINCDLRKVVIEETRTSMLATEFATRLCHTYTRLIQDEKAFKWFETFFGLRDFIYFLKAIKCRSDTSGPSFTIYLKTIVWALQRNFNGCEFYQLKRVVNEFVLCLLSGDQNKTLKLTDNLIKRPIEVVREALSLDEEPESLSYKSRYKLIIDESDDDSIIRLLEGDGLIDCSGNSIFKLSGMLEDSEMERLTLVSGVKFAALQGRTALLSQTEAVNESFYDLFNQHFRSFKKDGETTYYANIAVGGMSRPSLVRPSFQCIIHVRASQLALVPAPFLNRFEKYRLKVGDFLFDAKIKDRGGLCYIVKQSKRLVVEHMAPFEKSGLYGMIPSDDQTIDSVFIGILSSICNGMDQNHSENCDAEIFTLTKETGVYFKECFVHFVKTGFAIEDIAVKVDTVIGLACKYLPVDDARFLTQILSNEANVSNNAIRQAFFGIMKVGPHQDTFLARICARLVQMLLTEVACSRLLMLATPEAIFANRRLLPSEMLDIYFQQEHFSLKAHVASCVSSANSNDMRTVLNIVYARTDAHILSLPMWPPAEKLDASDAKASRVMASIHEDTSSVIIQHMNQLKSESSVRACIEFWAKHETRHVFLMLIDMSEANSTDRANFVRCYVDHLKFAQVHQKSFTLLLSHSPSMSNLSSSYPALFLGGWGHVFLDNVGGSNHSVDVKQFLMTVCEEEKSEYCKRPGFDVRPSLENLLPKVLIHVAGQNIFYQNTHTNVPTILLNGKMPFQIRHRILNKLMDRRIGISRDLTVGKILCQKFATLWTEDVISNIIERTSHNIMRGTSQLSLSSSIYSVLQDTFTSFLVATLLELNSWRNLDLLTSSESCYAVDELYYELLKDLPGIPFQELLLYRSVSGRHPLPPLPYGFESASFPLFYYVFSFLEKLLDNVDQRTRRELMLVDEEKNVTSDVGKFPAAFHVKDTIAQDVMTMLDDPELTPVPSKRKLIKTVVLHLANSTDEGRIDLFKRYVNDLMQVKFGKNISPDWLLQLLDSLPDRCRRNIIQLHLFARKFENKLWQMASWCDFLSVIPATASGPVIGYENSTLLSPATSVQIMENFIQVYAKKIIDGHTQSLESFFWYLRILPKSFDQLNYISQEHTSALRILCFLQSLSFAQAPQEVLINVQGKFYNDENKLCPSGCDVSLESFFVIIEDSIDTNTCWRSRAYDRLIRHFFSEWWLEYFYDEQDVIFLISHMNSDRPGAQRHLFVSLLRNALVAGGALNEAGKEGMIPLRYFSNLCLSASSKVLHGICLRTRVATGEGTRSHFQHYVPEWLRQTNNVEDTEGTERDNLSRFFGNYHHDHNTALSDIMFDLVFCVLVDEAKSYNSEQLLMLLLEGIDQECAIDENEKIRQSRLLALPQVSEMSSLQGTSMAAMILDARVTCFLLSVARELATDERAVSLNGLNRGIANEVFSKIMSCTNVRWESLFFSTIVRLRGEAHLLRLLRGPLRNCSWANHWVLGAPSLLGGVEDELRDAEKRLRETREEEDRKAREFRRCPNCQIMFGVAALNCGRFICGQDFHGNNAAEYGCRHAFDINMAPRYIPDVSLLQPLEQEQEVHRLRLAEHNSNAEQWQALDDFYVPFMSFQIERDPDKYELVPTSYLLDEQQKLSPFVLFFIQERLNVKYFAFLPDLIEFYLWIHSTFRFLLTKERAHQICIEDLMNPEILKKRFDSTVVVEHLLRVWERVVYGYNSYISDSRGKTFWECEMVKIPFNDIRRASIISLLSESNHPTEGHDFLFLVLNDICGRYNSFAEKLNAMQVEALAETETERLVAKEIHPKLLIRGGGGAVVGLRWKIDSLLQSHWTEDKFDLEGLNRSVIEEVGVQKLMPVIMNLTTYLREQMIFQLEATTDGLSGKRARESFNRSSVGGLIFAHSNNLNLFEEVMSMIDQLGVECEGDLIFQPLRVLFHESSYEELRATLEGLRSLTNAVLLEKVCEPNFTLKELVNIITESGFASARKEYESIERISDTPISHLDLEVVVHKSLDKLWFSHLNEHQERFIMNLKVSQVRNAVLFFGEQLATEAYIFRELKLGLSDPMPIKCQEIVRTAVLFLASKKGADYLETKLYEFVHDILEFYERIIIEEASSKSISDCLKENNACDENDPILRILPQQICIKHYISLRKELHQLRLEAIILSVTDDNDDVLEDTSLVANQDNKGQRRINKRGDCWLWKDDSERASTLEQDDECSSSGSELGYDSNLWFGDVVNNFNMQQDGSLPLLSSDNTSSVDDSTSICHWSLDEEELGGQALLTHTGVSRDFSLENEVEGNPTKAAIKIQMWWRYMSKCPSELSTNIEDSIEVQEAPSEKVERGEISHESPVTTVTRDSSSSQVISPIICGLTRHFVSIPFVKVVLACICLLSLCFAYNVLYTSITKNEPSQYNSYSQILAWPLGNELMAETLEIKNWLLSHQLPEALAKELFRFGARSIKDVVMIEESLPEFFETLLPLDAIKLRRAINLFRQESQTE